MVRAMRSLPFHALCFVATPVSGFGPKDAGWGQARTRSQLFSESIGDLTSGVSLLDLWLDLPGGPADVTGVVKLMCRDIRQLADPPVIISGVVFKEPPVSGTLELFHDATTFVESGVYGKEGVCLIDARGGCEDELRGVAFEVTSENAFTIVPKILDAASSVGSGGLLLLSARRSDPRAFASLLMVLEALGSAHGAKIAVKAGDAGKVAEAAAALLRAETGLEIGAGPLEFKALGSGVLIMPLDLETWKAGRLYGCPLELDF